MRISLLVPCRACPCAQQLSWLLAACAALPSSNVAGCAALACSAAVHRVMQGPTEPAARSAELYPCHYLVGNGPSNACEGKAEAECKASPCSWCVSAAVGSACYSPVRPSNLADPACTHCVRTLCGARRGKEPCACELAPRVPHAGGCEAPAVGNLHLHQPLRTRASAERPAALHPHAYSGSPDHGRLHARKRPGNRWLSRRVWQGRHACLIQPCRPAQLSCRRVEPWILGPLVWPWWHSRRLRGPLSALGPVGF